MRCNRIRIGIGCRSLPQLGIVNLAGYFPGPSGLRVRLGQSQRHSMSSTLDAQYPSGHLST